MRDILKWIVLAFIVILLLIVFFVFGNKTTNKSKANKTDEPVVYERPISSQTSDDTLDTSLDDTNSVMVDTVEVGDTASSADAYICFGMFVLISGIYYIRRYTE